MIDATVHSRTPTATVAVRVRAPVSEMGALFETADVEIGVPVAGPIGDLRALADCEPGEMGHSELPALQAWIAKQDRSICGAPWESYVDDPTEVSEADLHTEVCWPLS